jgi:BCD family chlorophyll transporter-like MFS transporter
VQASAGGAAVAFGGALRDAISSLAMQGALGEVLQSAATGYGFVYQLELGLLFAALVAIGPLVRPLTASQPVANARFGLADLPG